MCCVSVNRDENQDSWEVVLWIWEELPGSDPLFLQTDCPSLDTDSWRQYTIWTQVWKWVGRLLRDSGITQEQR